MRSALALSFRCLSFVAIFVAVSAQAQHPRPAITGISHIAVYTSDAQATNQIRKIRRAFAT